MTVIITKLGGGGLTRKTSNFLFYILYLLREKNINILRVIRFIMGLKKILHSNSNSQVLW